MRNVFPFIKPEPMIQEHFCSFCQRMERSVVSLFKSNLNNHCICERCIRHCKTRIDEIVIIEKEPEKIEFIQYD